jgi:hypothetical protein
MRWCDQAAEATGLFRGNRAGNHSNGNRTMRKPLAWCVTGRC